MSTFQRLTLIGLYNHYPALFSKLTLPAAYDVDTFTDTLLLDQGEKCVAYPEPQFMEYAIGVWSRKWAAALERIALALNSEYNPIHNYDRYEEWRDHTEGDYRNDLKRGGSDTTTDKGETNTDSTGSITVNATKTTEEKVSAFNESEYQPKQMSDENGNTITGSTNTEKVTATNDETHTYGGTEDGTGDDRRDSTHDGHLYGNIGVTTSQQMIQAEIDLRSNQNMYAIAAELFADDLLLMLY